MKKTIILSAMAIAVLIFSNCSSSKKAAGVPKLTYESSIQTVVMANCSPCHIPAKGGNKKPYDNFTNVQKDIDEMIRRIELNPGEKGYMPFKRAKLSDSTIAIFKQWRTDGLLEK
ncbi:MAG TPA: cytochrome c [Chitinophagaceae bacterium]